MDATFRIIHVMLGVFWAGTSIFGTVLLFPTLKKLGPSIEQPAVGALMKVLGPVLTVSSLLVMGTGVAMVLRTGQPIGVLLGSGWGWGWAMLFGFIAVLISFILGIGVLAPTGVRLEKILNKTKGRQATAEEASLVKKLSFRIETVAKVETGFIIIGVLMMPVARFL